MAGCGDLPHPGMSASGCIATVVAVLRVAATRGRGDWFSVFSADADVADVQLSSTLSISKNPSQVQVHQVVNLNHFIHAFATSLYQFLFFHSWSWRVKPYSLPPPQINVDCACTYASLFSN